MDTSAFFRANSTNLPEVDLPMIVEFLKSSDKHNVAEIRGAKALMSSRVSYLESAVGYVEVKRSGEECVVRAKIVPEHKISQRYYVVSVNLKNEEIIDTSCDGCAAAAGGCKHTLVLIYWLQKRSAEPSPTEVKCYWQKPSLTSARQGDVGCKELYKAEIISMPPKDSSVLEKLRNEAIKHSCKDSLIMCFDTNTKSKKLTRYCLFDIMVDFAIEETDHTYENFKLYSNQKVQNARKKITEATQSQVNSKLWHGIRQARITGSKLYEIAHCKTSDGCLVQELLGGYKLMETKAMQRGRLLEKQIIKKIQEDFSVKVDEAGFYLIDGIFGASPDGITDNYVIEIKCPISEKTKKNYIYLDKISDKCMAQIQLQMLATGKKQCLFCVADPKFTENNKIEHMMVDFNAALIESLMCDAEIFWKTNVFPKIYRSALVL